MIDLNNLSGEDRRHLSFTSIVSKLITVFAIIECRNSWADTRSPQL